MKSYKQYSAIADLHNLQFTVTHTLSLSLMLRQTVCLGIKHPSGAYDQIFIIV
jgi:hypothetical protein